MKIMLLPPHPSLVAGAAGAFADGGPDGPRPLAGRRASAGRCRGLAPNGRLFGSAVGAGDRGVGSSAGLPVSLAGRADLLAGHGVAGHEAGAGLAVGKPCRRGRGNLLSVVVCRYVNVHG